MIETKQQMAAVDRTGINSYSIGLADGDETSLHFSGYVLQSHARLAENYRCTTLLTLSI